MNSHGKECHVGSNTNVKLWLGEEEEEFFATKWQSWFLSYFERNLNTEIPECPPNVETHSIEPEECCEEGELHKKR